MKLYELSTGQFGIEGSTDTYDNVYEALASKGIEVDSFQLKDLEETPNNLFPNTNVVAVYEHVPSDTQEVSDEATPE